MFVVKRPFKNYGKTYEAGSVIKEPATIKRFKGKLAEGKIINVTEQTYDISANYFKEKFGVELPLLTNVDTEATVETNVDAEVETNVDAEVEVEVEASVDAETKAKPVKVSAKAKAVSK